MKLRSLLQETTVVASLTLMLVGCDNEQIESYRVEKEQPPAATPAPSTAPTTPAASGAANNNGMSMGAGAAAVPMHNEGSIQWTLPEGWTESSEARPMRMATLIVGSDEQRAEVAVSSLGGSAGGLLPNINRWRGQLGMTPVDSLEAQPMTTVMAGEAEILLVDLTPPDQPQSSAMLVGVCPTNEATYFFKMTGSAAAIAQHKPGMIRFLESVRMDGG